MTYVHYISLRLNILYHLADHHAKLDLLIKNAMREFSSFLAAYGCGVSKADEHLASFLQHKTNAIKQVVHTINQAPV